MAIAKRTKYDRALFTFQKETLEILSFTNTPSFRRLILLTIFYFRSLSTMTQ